MPPDVGGWGQLASAGYDFTGTLGHRSLVGASKAAGYNLGSCLWGGIVRMFAVAIESISCGIAEGVRLTWHGIADQTYVVYFTDSLTTAWNAASTLAGTGGLVEWLDDGTATGTSPMASGVLNRFYRLSGQP